MAHDIEVEIDEATGETTFEMHGVKGKDCLKKLKWLMDLGKVDGVKPTAEMYQEAAVKVAQRR